jgi:hypothetical protein
MMMNSYFSIWIAIRHFATAINKLLIVKSHHPLLHTKTGRTIRAGYVVLAGIFHHLIPTAGTLAYSQEHAGQNGFCRENTPALDSNEISI